jgi:hypothetical protein
MLASDYLRAGRLDEAESLASAALARSPHAPDALHVLARVAFRRGELARAAALATQAAAHEPSAAQHFQLQRAIYEALGDFRQAAAAAQRAVELLPADAMAHYELGTALGWLGDINGARHAADAAIALSPDLAAAHFMRATALLLTGEFAEGWREYEWRLRLPGTAGGIPPADWACWDGTPMPKEQRLLLFADQGRGDIIQFARYIDWAAERCANIVMSCPGEMWPVLRQFTALRGIVEQWYQAGTCAAYVPLGSLPMLAATRVASIPAPVPYLRANPVRAARWRVRLDGLLPTGVRRIGLVWAGGSSHVNDNARSMHLRELEPLGAVDNVALVALQKGPAQAQVGQWFGRAPLLQLGPLLTDFDDTMAVLDCLDLVVCVDTAVAHLAGAMGRPVWLMLPLSPDWRWLLGRDDTPWYPTLRLFRQSAPRDWTSVVRRITDALSAGQEACSSFTPGWKCA